jgi:hypothetical protein
MTRAGQPNGRRIDLTGQRFGRLVVVMYGDPNSRAVGRWVCRCDCGKLKVVAGDSLRGGRTQSCGCYRRDRLTGAVGPAIKRGKDIDITGQRFARLEVIARESTGSGWLCRCDCGGTKVTDYNKLRRGLVRSCGCLKEEYQAKKAKAVGFASLEERQKDVMERRARGEKLAEIARAHGCSRQRIHQLLGRRSHDSKAG